MVDDGAEEEEDEASTPRRRKNDDLEDSDDDGDKCVGATVTMIQNFIAGHEIVNGSAGTVKAIVYEFRRMVLLTKMRRLNICFC